MKDEPINFNLLQQCNLSLDWKDFLDLKRLSVASLKRTTSEDECDISVPCIPWNMVAYQNFS